MAGLQPIATPIGLAESKTIAVPISGPRPRKAMGTAKRPFWPVDATSENLLDLAVSQEGDLGGELVSSCDQRRGGPTTGNYTTS